MAEGFVRVALDSTGKYIRNIELLVKQPDGTYLLVEQQAVTRTADDGTILDTMGWVETSREGYMRRIAEATLEAEQAIVALLGGPFAAPVPPTVSLGE